MKRRIKVWVIIDDIGTVQDIGMYKEKPKVSFKWLKVIRGTLLIDTKGT